MDVLAVDIGGTHVKILATGQEERQEFESGPKLTPQSMVANVKELAKDWKYDLVSIGYPGPVRFNRPIAEPRNLAKGWAGFNIGGLVPALQLDEVVLGGGNVKKLKRLPAGCRGGDNVDAFLGGFRLWEDEHLPRAPRNNPLFAVKKKSSPHQHQKTRLIQKDRMKGAAA
jgi:hypothetical protein